MRLGRMLAAIAATIACMSAHGAPQDWSEAMRQRVQDHLRTGDIAALDAEMQRLRTRKARVSGGRWKLAMFVGALQDELPKIISSDAASNGLEWKADAFRRAHRNSANAGVILAEVFQAQAWQARGTGFANTVSPPQWKAFDAKMRLARSVLDEDKRVASVNPAWYTSRIDVATVSSEGRAKIDALLREALAREPRYQSHYLAGLWQELPRWGGSKQAMMAYINRVARSTAGARAEGMYARLVWYAADDYATIEYDPGLDWDAMRASFDSILQSYPDEKNAQEFFFMACMQSDKSTATKLLTYVHAAPDAELLKKNVDLYGMCIDWTKGSLDMFIVRDHDPETGAVVEHLIQ